jgi:hypothetical protein
MKRRAHSQGRSYVSLLALPALGLLVPVAACQSESPEPGLSDDAASAIHGGDSFASQPSSPEGDAVSPGEGPVSVIPGGVCEPYEWRPCYTGPEGTEGTGACRGGYQECRYDGTGWHEWCDGEVTPTPESCLTQEDDNCDGVENEGCVCLPWEEQACCLDNGQGVIAACDPGVRPCAADGLSWGECRPVTHSCAAPAVPGTHNFSRSIGSGNSIYNEAVAVDGDCNVYFTGYHDGIVDLGAGPVDSLSHWGWGDAFLAKLDSHGNHIWSKHFREPSGRRNAMSIAIDGTGHINIAGPFIGDIDLGAGKMTSAGGNDVFVGKFDDAGNLLWQRRFGSAGHDFGINVASDAAGNVFVAGMFEQTVDFGTGPMTSPGFNRDVFLIKLSPTGTILWSKHYPEPEFDYSFNLATDSAGNLFASSPASRRTLKLDPNGNELWKKPFGGNIAIDAAGNLVIGGSFTGTFDFGGGPLVSAGGEDAYLGKFDPSGNHIWSARYGDAANQSAWTTPVIDGSGNVVVVGFWDGTLDFGGGPVTTGSGKLYAVKFTSSGSYISASRYGDVVGDVAIHPSGNLVMAGGYSGLVHVGGGTLPPSVQLGGYIASFAP